MIDRLCVIGVGLIGGSVAKAARRRGLCREIIGVDGSDDNRRKAVSMGVIDGFNEDVAAAAANADFIVMATPVGAMESLFRALKPAWRPQAVYMDVGSTKASIVAAADQVFGQAPANFVPTHPIAGAETSGVAASSARLFEGRRIILTPLQQTDPGALTRVREFWLALGCTVSEMDVAHHDAVLAATSHVPHVIAYALADLLGRKDEQDEILMYAAGGFKDFTRIASSDPTMWLDICMANRVEIIKLIEQFNSELRNLSKMLEQGARADLLEVFENAGKARARFLRKESVARAAVSDQKERD